MAKSQAFERNACLVAEVVESIPRGRCTTYGAIGTSIGIVPRYVALIMATAEDIHATPWHRVVGRDKMVKPGGHRSEQIKRLKAEGFRFNGDLIADFDERFYTPAD